MVIVLVIGDIPGPRLCVLTCPILHSNFVSTTDVFCCTHAFLSGLCSSGILNGLLH